MMIPKRHNHQDEEQPNFWVSYSDLMAGMMLVFVLLLVVAMYNYADSIRMRQERLVEQEVKLKSFYELQRRLVDQLKNSFSAETVSVDPDTGILQIGSGILFGEGEAELRAEGRRRLSQIFEVYMKVVLDPQFREFIKQIEIEGHTNSNGTYLYNLELSQRRALSVMEALLFQAGDYRDELKRKVVASGRAFSHLVLDEQGREDPIASRRIEIKFRLKEEEMFRDIYRGLDQALAR